MNPLKFYKNKITLTKFVLLTIIILHLPKGKSTKDIIIFIENLSLNNDNIGNIVYKMNNK